jgi:hypothetical protein
MNPIFSEARHARRELCPKKRLDERQCLDCRLYANPLLTYAQKPRTETEEKACSSERAKEAVR